MATPEFDPRQTMRDLIVAFRHPRFRDQRPIETIRQLKRSRDEYV